MNFIAEMQILKRKNSQLLERANKAEAALVKFEQLAADEIQGFKAIQAEVAKLREENKKLEYAFSGKYGLQAKNKKLREDLLEFGRHAEGCSRAFGPKYRCKCGWAELEQALQKKGE